MGCWVRCVCGFARKGSAKAEGDVEVRGDVDGRVFVGSELRGLYSRIQRVALNAMAQLSTLHSQPVTLNSDGQTSSLNAPER
eukprot:809371-Rhodomonas_salina.1